MREEITTPAEDLRQRIHYLEDQLSEARRRLPKAEVEEVNQIRANHNAERLLRAAGPEGEALADGQGVLIPSSRFPDVTYALHPNRAYTITVCLKGVGQACELCITAKDDAPAADMLLTKLRLCQADEERLWTTANDLQHRTWEAFLPRQIRQWVAECQNSKQPRLQGELVNAECGETQRPVPAPEPPGFPAAG